MAHWNPYFSGSTQNNTFYENQNQPFYNTVPYGIGYQQYDAYYMQNSSDFMPNTPATIRTAREVEAEQLLYSQNQQSQTTTVQDERGPTQAVFNSNLTATAAEFKPSSLTQPLVEIKTQTFSNNNYKNENKSRNYDNKEKSKENEPGTSKSNEHTQNFPKNKGNFMKFNNKKSYNRSDSDRTYSNDRNYSTDRYNRSKDRDRDRERENRDRDNRFKSNSSSKDDIRQEQQNNSTKITTGSGRFPNYQRDNYYSNRYSRNGENSYSRNNYESYDR